MSLIIFPTLIHYSILFDYIPILLDCMNENISPGVRTMSAYSTDNNINKNGNDNKISIKNIAMNMNKMKYINNKKYQKKLYIQDFFNYEQYKQTK